MKKEIKHGTQYLYRLGCRCDVCVLGNKVYRGKKRNLKNYRVQLYKPLTDKN